MDGTGRRNVRFAVCRLTAALAITLYCLTGLQARVTHPLDDWLSAHPKVAGAIIWEFPPPPPQRAELVPKVALWTQFFVTPYPSQTPPLSFSSFSDPAILRLIEDGVPLSVLVEGMDAGRIVSTVPKRGGPKAPGRDPTALAGNTGDVQELQSAASPGSVLDFIPSGVKISEYGAEIRTWWHWSEAAKQELRNRFDDYAAWAATACPLYEQYAASKFSVKPAGFDDLFTSVVDLDPVPVVHPPVNIQPHQPGDEDVPWPMLDSEAAFALYVRQVAAQLALEMEGCLPWSVLDYPAGDLRKLFDGRKTFRYIPEGPSYHGTMSETGHIVAESVTPSPPLMVLGFLGQHGILGTSRLDTILRLYTWERENLSHVSSGATSIPLAGGELYWGYNGRAPVTSIINGTTMAATLIYSNGFEYFEPALRHWIAGCGGAAGFTAQVANLLNIGVEHLSYSHHHNRIALGSAVYVATAHADDPYGTRAEIPISDILLDDATFHAWFVNESDPAIREKNVSRRAADLWLQYLPTQLLKYHCWDLNQGKDRANSFVYNSTFSSVYSVAEMEEKGLWTGIETKLAALGGCPAVL